MVAMYIIFLGIIPSILLILFLVYYSRHNVLYWWKKPSKSYVNCLLCKCCGTNVQQPHKGTFGNRFARFQNSTSSLRYLLSFKRNNSTATNHVEENQTADVENHIYDIPEEVVKKQPLHYKILDLADKNQCKRPLKKPNRKINKDDIHIADSSAVARARPPVMKKPDLKENKPTVSIVKQGLASTTNAMLVKQKSSLYNVGNKAVQPTKAPVEIAKVNGIKK